jgi:hypothetical protein
MKRLRDHPGWSYHGFSTWPPAWTWVGGTENKQIEGEVGRLQRVAASASNRCYLSMEYEDNAYIGCLRFDDYPLFERILKLVQDHCGDSIEVIGDLDVRYDWIQVRAGAS